MIEVFVDEGLLAWDGRVVELFRHDGRDGAFRLHARVVHHWEWEPRRGVDRLKLFDAERHYHGVMVSHADRPRVDEMLAELDAARA